MKFKVGVRSVISADSIYEASIKLNSCVTVIVKWRTNMPRFQSRALRSGTPKRASCRVPTP